MNAALVGDEIHGQTLAPVARTATATGASVRSGRDGGPRKAVFDIGLWTDGVFTHTFEQSPDDSVWTALTAAQLDFQAGLVAGMEVGATLVVDAAAEDNQVVEVGLLATEEYTRVVQTVTGSPGTGAIIGVDIVTGKLRAAGGAGQPMSASGYQRTQPSI